MLKSPRAFVLLLFCLALFLRLFSLILRHEFQPPPVVGAEAGIIADHLLAGHGFASPFVRGPGAPPSTHLPPLYPMMLASLRSLAPGVEFYGALVLNLLASALLPIVALAIGKAANFPTCISRTAAILLCFCPEALRAAGLIWDEALFTLLTALILLWMLRHLLRPLAPTLRPALILGLFNGALALLNPTMVLALPLAWLAGLRARGILLKTLVAHAVVLAAATFLASSPWHIRNWLLLKPPAPVFIRGNFWLEVWSSLHPIERIQNADGTVQLLPVHPWQGTDPLVRTDGLTPVKLTEQQYFAWCRDRALQAFRDNPRLLLTHIANQFNAFWLGIAEARRWYRNPIIFFLAQGLPAIAGIVGLYFARKRIPPPPLALLCTLLIIFPLPYYLTGGAARYRHPIDLVLYLGTAWLLCLAGGLARRSASPNQKPSA